MNDTHSQTNQLGAPRFPQRVLIAVGIVTAVVVLLLLLWNGAQVFLLLFTGMLFAVFLGSLADLLHEHTSLGKGWSLLVIILALIGLIALGVWLLIPTISEQVQRLADLLPNSLAQLRQQLTQFPWVQQVLSQMPQAQELLPQSTNVLGRVTGIFSTALGVLVNIVIIIFVGIYLAADPQLYRRGIVRLLPRHARDRANAVLDTLGYTLRWWLLGRLSIMAINGALTALGLWLLGIPLPILNGIITGLLNFIPNIGPFLAAVPALLLAFEQGPMYVLYVAILYLFIQNLEGFVLTPLVQQRTVDLPPVLILSAQLLLGIFFGFLGLLLAVPITAVGFVLIKMLYVEDILGDNIKVKGEEEATGNSSG